jgi:hypothetical protein
MQMDWQNIIENVIVNLFTDAISIAVTVLVIDRLLKKREEQRWRPTKSALRARIFGAVQDIVGFMPSEYLQAPDLRIYRFGNSYVFAYQRVIEPFPMPDKLTESIISTHLKIDALLGKLRIDCLNTAKKTIDDIINTSGFMLEPELIELPLTLDERFLILKETEKQDGDLNNEEYSKQLATIISGILEIGYELNKRLDQQADRYFTSVKDYMNDIFPPSLLK